MRKFVSLLLAFVMAFSVLGVVGAQDADARLRVVHAAPDAPNVDVYANGEAVLTDVPFFTISDYLSVPAGSYQLQVVAAGETDLSAAVIDATVDLVAGTDYTVAAINTLENIEPLVLEDNNAAPDAGNAHIRFIHASPDAPAVDIRVADGPVLFSNIAFGEVGDYTPVAAGTYDLEVVPAGGDEVVLSVPGVTLDEGTVYGVWATGLLDSLAAEVGVDATPDTTTGGEGEGEGDTEEGDTEEGDTEEGDTTGGDDTAGGTPPSDLPTTGAADSLPLILVALMAALVATAGILVRQRAVRS